jgi:hypothetical protein
MDCSAINDEASFGGALVAFKLTARNPTIAIRVQRGVPRATEGHAMRTVLMATIVVVVLAGCNDADPATTAGPVTATHGGQASDARGGETVSTSSGSAASCIEEYSLRTLRNRKFAFDGTVASIRAGEPDSDAGGTPVRVTYEVHQWFVGGDGDTVTLASWDFITDGLSLSGDPEPTEGMRLLVSGDTDMAWGCGFTRPYSAGEAAQWEAAFAD